jgi:ubiquinone/menaquinone biosynthesis C-methylase UbiE
MDRSTFDRLCWRDPVSGRRLIPRVTARTPGGTPLCGALQVEGDTRGYPVVDAVARLTVESARRHREWLPKLGLDGPGEDGRAGLQSEASVESFGFQWGWNSAMRSEADLRWRTAERFGVGPELFAGKLVLDAGAGAGDQSRWLLDAAAEVVSLDLSAAIDVVARKLRPREGWTGVQGDITALPFEDGQFDIVYCEGVIQHTRDSALAVRELCRVLKPGGTILATHYDSPTRLHSKLKARYMGWLRSRLSSWDRYHLLLLTGIFAALAHVPLVGRLLRLSGTAIHSSLMPDFKTTWTNTFDNFGTHTYQRYVSGDEFWSYFERAGRMAKLRVDGNVVVARRLD